MELFLNNLIKSMAISDYKTWCSTLSSLTGTNYYIRYGTISASKNIKK